jgi:hypothetical protein
MALPSSESVLGLRQVWGTSNKNVFVAGSALFRYDGKRWSEVRLPQITRWTAFALGGCGPNDVYALAGYDGVHFDGKRWKGVIPDDGVTLSSVNVSAVWCGAKNDVIAVGRHDVENAITDQEYLHFDGNSWQEVATGHQDELDGIAGRDRDHLYAIGKTVYRLKAARWTPDSRFQAPETGVDAIAACAECVVAVGENFVSRLCE